MIRKAFALLGAAILLVLGFVFSVVVVSVIAVLGLAACGYFWWKTRRLRSEMREHAADADAIEGEVIVVQEETARLKVDRSDDPPKQ